GPPHPRAAPWGRAPNGRGAPMPARRTIVLGALTAAVVVAGGAVAVTALDDPDGSAAPVDISDRSAADVGEPARAGANRQAPGLEEPAGTVTADAERRPHD